MDSTLDTLAARLAILALRASLSRAVRLRYEVIRIAGSRDRLAPDALATLLAASPKPLLCTAREAGGRLEVAYGPLRPGTREHDWHTTVAAMAAERGGRVVWYLPGEPDTRPTLPVLCIGTGEQLLVPAAAAERWYRDYSIREVNIRGDRADNPLCGDWAEYQLARQQGAAGLLLFSSPVDETARAVIREREL